MDINFIKKEIIIDLNASTIASKRKRGFLILSEKLAADKTKMRVLILTGYRTEDKGEKVALDRQYSKVRRRVGDKIKWRRAKDTWGKPR